MPVQRRPAGRLIVDDAFLPLALACAASCSEPVDFKQALQVTDVSGGWFDFGIVDGKNKLVPSVTFKIRKPADVRMRSLSLNVHFKKIVDPSKPGLEGEEEFDEVFLQTVEFEGQRNRAVDRPAADRLDRRRAADASRDAATPAVPGHPRASLRQAELDDVGRTRWHSTFRVRVLTK